MCICRPRWTAWRHALPEPRHLGQSWRTIRVMVVGIAKRTAKQFLESRHTSAAHQWPRPCSARTQTEPRISGRLPSVKRGIGTRFPREGYQTTGGDVVIAMCQRHHGRCEADIAGRPDRGWSDGESKWRKAGRGVRRPRGELSLAFHLTFKRGGLHCDYTPAATISRQCPFSLLVRDGG